MEDMFILGWTDEVRRGNGRGICRSGRRRS